MGMIELTFEEAREIQSVLMAARATWADEADYLEREEAEHDLSPGGSERARSLVEAASQALKPLTFALRRASPAA